MTDVVEEEGAIEEASDDRFELEFELGAIVFIFLGAPGHEPFFAGGEGADAGVGAVADDEGLVIDEEVADFGFVGLELGVGLPDVGFNVGGVFEFEDGEGEAVDEEEDVGAAMAFGGGDRELVGDEEVVVVGVLEVDELDVVGGFVALGAAVFDFDAFEQLVMEGAVVFEQVEVFGAEEGLDGGFDRALGEAGVEAGEGGGEVAGEEDVVVVGAIGGCAVGGEVRAGDVVPSGFLEPLETKGFELGFGDHDGIGVG